MTAATKAQKRPKTKQTKLAQSTAPIARVSAATAPVTDRVMQDAKQAAAEWVPLTRLKLWADNPRSNDGEPVARVVASIKRFGFGAPIVARRSNGEIIAGHTRFKAATELKLPVVPVRWLDVGEHDAHLLAVADNRHTELTPWAGTLTTVLGQFDMPEIELAGWSQVDLDKMAAELRRIEGALEEGETPEPPTKPITKLGDVWLLGRHRLVCGDCTQGPVVKSAHGGAKSFLMVTDPPYGVNYDGAEWRGKMIHDHKSPRSGVVLNDHTASWAQAWKLFGGAVAYVWHGGGSGASIVENDLNAAGLHVRSQIVWAKPQLVISRGHYHGQHEPCWYAVREGTSSKWVGDRKQSTLWTISRNDASEKTVHSTQKPIECMARPIRNHGGKTDHVYEPFAGSGTTLIAAEQLERTCFAVELSPAYCDVIVQRWQNLTGGKAQRQRA